MSTWAPGDGAPDLLSSGPDGPLWVNRVRTAAVAVVCLAAGALLGARWDEADLPLTAQAAPPQPVLTAGSVSAVVESSRPLPHEFEVSLFNPGGQEVGVLVVGLVGSGTRVTTGPPVDVPPKSWARVAFSLPDVCEELTPPRVTALRVRILHPGSAGERRVELAEPTDAVQHDRQHECLPPTRMRRGRLAGLWHLEEVRGRWETLEGRSLMRFTSDGRFAFDSEGQVFMEGWQGFVGTYRLDGSLLRLRSEGGYACEAGFSEVWRTTSLSEDLLQLDIVRSDGGYCNSPPTERRVLRRLVPESGLPAAEAPTSR